MKYAGRIIALMTVLGAAATAASSEVTVLLQFDVPAQHPETMAALESEVKEQLKPTGIKVELKRRDEVDPQANFTDVILVKFRGTCTMQHWAPLIDERGPWAWTHTVDGEVLPFSEVACDQVRRAVKQAMWGGERKQANALYGRALGRVLAHELFHILAKTTHHGKDGLAKTALTPRQLIDDSMVLDEHDVDRIRFRQD
jgi:hypothetical protein